MRGPICPYGPDEALSARTGASPRQRVAALSALAAAGAAALLAPVSAAALSHRLLLAIFAAAIGFKLLLLLAPRRRPSAALHSLDRTPRYSVLCPLYDEPLVVPQLVAALQKLNYPRDRIEAIFLLEQGDAATASALDAHPLPNWMRILVVPGGAPRTKPRALNWGLSAAKGELIVVYDAEDRPDPDQLLEAAATFAENDAGLVCLQAPLRVRGGGPFFGRQFAAEYAALFEVATPALSRLGLPFPLGGTSNHFRAAPLRLLGGWDPFNVTEDADLTWRLHRRGYRLGVLSRPTWEAPPPSAREWLPQRTRWLKGWMRTWLVHMRSPHTLGLRGFASLQATIGLGLLSALAQAPAAALISGWAMMKVAGSDASPPGTADVLLLLLGWLIGVAACAEGRRRAGGSYALLDALAAPIYWSISSLALAHAVAQTLTAPHRWDKTEHRPDGPSDEEEAGRLAA